MEEHLTEEDFFIINEEQQQRLANLRLEREQEKFNKEEDAKLRAFNKENNLKKGDSIFVVLEGIEFSGFISDIQKNEEGFVEYFTAATSHGTLSDLSYKNIKRRDVEDLTGVVIPQEFKDKNTRQLLRELRIAQLLIYDSYEDWFRASYKMKQLKAELATREHIPSKREKLRIKELKCKKRK